MADPKPATSFEVAEQIAALLNGLSKAKRREALQLVASRDELRVVPMDRPIGRVGIPAPLSIDRKGPLGSSNKKNQGGTKVVPAKASTSLYRSDKILSDLNKERGTIVSQLKNLGDSQNIESVDQKGQLLEEKTRLESLIRDRRNDLRGISSPPK